MTQRILVVDDDRYDNDRYCQLLRSAAYEVHSVLDAEQALYIIKQYCFDVVLLDMLLPLRLQGKLDFGGIELLRRIKAYDNTIQVIAVTGYGSRELAAEAMALGAIDYITKDIDTDDRLPGSVRIAATKVQILRTTISASENPVSELSLTVPDYLVADSLAMRQLLRRAQSLARIQSSLLIVGAQGVGKELIANVVHLNSSFGSGPFVVASCRDLSSSLVELWGDVSKPGSGFCSQAEGGTLVLKSIQDLPFNQQKQVVDLVERQTYTPVGAYEQVQGRLRIIATTTADLERFVRQGRFWRALYNVLSVATLDVPPLHERRDKDDILAIAGYLLRRYGLAPGISPEAAEVLASYDYTQGNIRELEEILRFAASHAQGGILQYQHLPPELCNQNYKELSPVKLMVSRDSIIFSIRFVPGEPAMLFWDSHISGSSRSEFRLPFPETDLPLVLRALDAVQWPGHPNDGPQFSVEEKQNLSQLGIWDNGRVAYNIDQRVGRLLYQSVTSDTSARVALATLRNIATDKGQPLSIILRFQSNAILLAALPWELLWDERQAFLFSQGKLASCVRYIDLPQAIPPTPVIGRTLHLLAVCPSAGIPDHLHETEETGRLNALKPLVETKLLTMEELRPASIRSLIDRLQDGKRVDILHFYGHGIWKNNIAYLQFDDGLLDARRIAALVGDIPLVVLHACRSGMVSPDDLFTGIAPTLSTEGVSAVIAMQFTVSVAAANRFSEVLYRNIAKGASLQTAVAKARQALFIEYPESWYVPVVYIRSRDMGPVVLIK